MKTKGLSGALALGACLGVAQVAQAQTAMNNGSSTQSAQDWVTLRLNLKPGSRYRMTQTSQTKTVIVTLPMSGRPAAKTEVSGVGTNVLDYAVLYNNPDGTMQIRLTYGDMINNSTVKVNGKPQKLPGANATNNILSGQSIEMRLSPEGAVSDVRGADKIWKRSLAGVKGVTPQMRRQMESSMKQMLGDTFIKNLMQSSGMAYPQNPIRLGQAWYQRMETGGQLPLVVNLRRTLQSRNNGALTIGENGVLSIGDITKSVAFGPTSMQMALTGTYSGTTVLDEATGFARSATLSQRYGGTISAKAEGQAVSMRMFGLASMRTGVEQLS
jgi:hypothetical protein